jgi:hypothetical protein
MPQAASHGQKRGGSAEQIRCRPRASERHGLTAWAETAGQSMCTGIRRQQPRPRVRVHTEEVGPAEVLTPGRLRRDKQVGFFSRLLVPRSVRRAMHPVRTAKRAVTPKAVKRAQRPCTRSTTPSTACSGLSPLNPGRVAVGQPATGMGRRAP